MPESTPVDPDLHLEELGELLEQATSRSPFERHELYRRTSLTIRVARETDGADVAMRVLDEGVALRVRADDGSERFAACSGGGRSTVDWLVERCNGAGATAHATRVWPSRAAPPRIDRDEFAIPESDEVRSWLGAALDDLESWCAPRRLRTADAWVEAAFTLESWAAEPGLLGSRVRGRGWAMARVVDEAPLFVASRAWTELPTDGFRRVAIDRWAGAATAEEEPFHRGPLIVGPEASATLVATLVTALHRPERPPFSVGAGWNLVDAPGHRGALFGAAFDDVGFATGTVRLADGAQAVALPQKGRMRRSSYRDAPAARPWHIEVAPGRHASAEDADRLATTVVPHPITPSIWLVELYGARLDRGRPCGSFASVLRTDPENLVRCCAAGVGPARASYRGVVTPALLFDGLVDRSA